MYKKNFKRTTRKPRRNFKRTRYTRFKKTYRRRRFFKRKPINAKQYVTKCITQDYDLYMQATGTGRYFQLYVEFNPGLDEVLAVEPLLVANNSSSSVAVNTIGTITAGEQTAIKSMYGKTKLAKVIVKYRPAATMGVSQFLNPLSPTVVQSLSATNTMLTVPIYENTDDVVSAAGQYTQIPTQATYSSNKMKPYAREHSIYKPWTRVLKPQMTFVDTMYTGGVAYTKNSRWIDLTGTQAIHHGFLLNIPALKPAGLIVTATAPATIPQDLQSFILGKLTFTFYQKFKTRV